VVQKDNGHDMEQTPQVEKSDKKPNFVFDFITGLILAPIVGAVFAACVYALVAPIMFVPMRGTGELLLMIIFICSLIYVAIMIAVSQNGHVGRSVGLLTVPLVALGWLYIKENRAEQSRQAERDRPIIAMKAAMNELASKSVAKPLKTHSVILAEVELGDNFVNSLMLAAPVTVITMANKKSDPVSWKSESGKICLEDKNIQSMLSLAVQGFFERCFIKIDFEEPTTALVIRNSPHKSFDIIEIIERADMKERFLTRVARNKQDTTDFAPQINLWADRGLAEGLIIDTLEVTVKDLNSQTNPKDPHRLMDLADKYLENASKPIRGAAATAFEQAIDSLYPAPRNLFPGMQSSRQKFELQKTDKIWHDLQQKIINTSALLEKSPYTDVRSFANGPLYRRVHKGYLQEYILSEVRNIMQPEPPSNLNDKAGVNIPILDYFDEFPAAERANARRWLEKSADLSRKYQFTIAYRVLTAGNSKYEEEALKLIWSLPPERHLVAIMNCCWPFDITLNNYDLRKLVDMVRRMPVESLPEYINHFLRSSVSKKFKDEVVKALNDRIEAMVTSESKVQITKYRDERILKIETEK
jgi:hypothetical protein